MVLKSTALIRWVAVHAPSARCVWVTSVFICSHEVMSILYRCMCHRWLSCMCYVLSVPFFISHSSFPGKQTGRTPCLHHLNVSVVTLLPTFSPVCFFCISARMVFLKFKFRSLSLMLKILRTSVPGMMCEDRPSLPFCTFSCELYPTTTLPTVS